MVFNNQKKTEFFWAIFSGGVASCQFLVAGGFGASQGHLAKKNMENKPGIHSLTIWQ